MPLAEEVQADEVRFMNHRGFLIDDHDTRYLVAPVPLSGKPGSYTIELLHNGRMVETRTVLVEPCHYPEQHLHVKNRRKVNPAPDDMRRIRKEAVRKRTAKSARSDRMPETNFVWPVRGPVSSAFGLRRFFNDQPRSPHKGLDIAAPEGRPVRAAEEGVVVDAGNFFFSGNLVFIEHGQGLMTLYAHLSSIDVEPGERVKKGQVIGRVGSTGRVTGPHLHFSVLIDSVYVDPSLFLPDTQ